MAQKDTIRIYSFYYKTEKQFLSQDGYVHIWAGKNNAPENTDFTGDDTGKNISEKNKYYSELTGLYWVWKNTKSDVVGSCHYRRYFTKNKEQFFFQLKRLLYYPIGLWKKRYGLIYTKNYNYWENKILKKDDIAEFLSEYDAIMPTRRILKYTVEEHYSRYHNIQDLKHIESILKSDYPEYMEAYNRVLSNKRLFANNMFILKWERFNELMEWLFHILFRFEDEIDFKKYEGYQERIMGFLGERLITTWIYHHKLNYKELPLIYFKKLKPKANA